MGSRHTDSEFEAELSNLRERLLTMAGRVEQMIAASVRSLVERDSDLARRIIEEDHLVNRAEKEVDHLCLEILAKRQPMASDLRLIQLILKMVTDLERIGDLAANVCKQAVTLNAEPQLAPYVEIPRMASVVQTMIRDAINAFVAQDDALALAVIARDDEVDELDEKVFRRQLQLMLADPAAVERGIHTQSVAKYLERMADHATNVAEQVVFLVRGQDIRHAETPGDE